MNRFYEGIVFLIFCFLFSIIYAEKAETIYPQTILMIIPIGLIYWGILRLKNE